MKNLAFFSISLAALTLILGCGGEGSSTADDMVAGCLEALGGAEALQDIQIIHTVDSLYMSGMKGTSESWWVREPFMGLSVTEIGPVRQEVLIRGDSVWTVDRNGHLSPGGVEETDQMELSKVTVFYDYLLDPSMITFGQDTMIDSVMTVPMYIEHQPNVVFYYSRENWLPYLMTAQTMGMEVNNYPGDYQETDGIVSPRFSLSSIPAVGQEITTRNILTEYNVSVPESIFTLTQGAADWELLQPGVPHDFTLRGEHIFLQGEINGEPVNIILDSGAGATVLDSAKAVELGLDPTGNLPARGIGGTRDFSFAKVDSYSAAGARVENQTLTVLPLSGDFYPTTGERIDLILGYDFLSRFVTRLDYGNETVTLFDPDSFQVPQGDVAVLPAERSMSLLSIQAVLEDSIEVNLLLDTGAGGNMHLTPTFFQEHPSFMGDRPTFQTEIQGVGGMETITGFRVSSVTLGDFEVPGGICSSFQGGDMFSGYDGILGNGINSRFILYLDYNSNRVILTPSSIFEEGLPENLTGLSLEIQGEDLVLNRIVEGSPADEAGLMEGDVLEEINGTSVTPDLLGRMDSLMPDTVGATVQLLVSRDGNPVSVELTTGRLIP